MWAVAGDQLECWTEPGRGRERPTGKEGPEGVEGNKEGVVTRVGKGPNGWGALEDFCMVLAEWGGRVRRRRLPRQGRGAKGGSLGMRGELGEEGASASLSLPTRCGALQWFN